MPGVASGALHPRNDAKACFTKPTRKCHCETSKRSKQAHFPSNDDFAVILATTDGHLTRSSVALRMTLALRNTQTNVMQLSSKGIVLSRENFGEADRYVQFFTKDWGLITVLARSARKSKKRYVGGLDLFCHDEIFIRGEHRPYLVELVVLNSFAGIHESLESLLTAGKVLQYVRQLVPFGTSMPPIYRLLGQTLSLIEKEKQPLALLCLLFKWKLLAEIGLKPKVDGCTSCSKQSVSDLVFDISAGGLLCSRCVADHKGPIDPVVLEAADLNCLQQLDAIKLGAWRTMSLPFDKMEVLSRLLTQFVSFHTHVRLPV